MKILRKKKAALLSALFIMCGLTACKSSPDPEYHEMTGIYFDTIVRIEVWGADASVLEHCKELCETYEDLFSYTVEDSEISQINAAAGRPVHVSPETIELLQKGIFYGRLSEGRFDITIAPVSSLWDFHNNANGTVPEAPAIEEAVAHVDYNTIQIEGDTVTLSDPQAAIDLGGIAKGYIADRLKEYLVGEGVSHALINLGGNVLAVGSRPDGKPFHIGIQRPFDKQGQPITTLDITDASVVSSGTYERYFRKNGRLYHHILDPRTGYPYENDLMQVTIISENSVDGDALSTCCFALGLEEGSRLIESMDGVGAIFVTDDHQLHRVGTFAPPQ